MQQRIIITNVDDIKIISHDISPYHTRKRIFKVQLNQFSEQENQDVERQIVRLYHMGQHSGLNLLPLLTIVLYLSMVSFGWVPFHQIGIVPTIILYAPFAIICTFIVRILVVWYARKSMQKLASELSNGHSYSFG